MPRVRSSLVIFIVLVASTCLADQNWVVRPDGIGPIRIGMKLSDLKTTLHLTYKLEFAQDSDQETCFYAVIPGHAGVGLMILNGRVARVDVDNPDTQTVEGIKNGDTEAHARGVFGKRLRVTPHAYTGPQGHYLTVRSDDGQYGIRFETDGLKIVRYYAGRVSAISYIEGCE